VVDSEKTLKVCDFIGKWCKRRNTLAKNWMMESNLSYGVTTLLCCFGQCCWGCIHSSISTVLVL